MSRQLHPTSDEVTSLTDTPMNMSTSYASTSSVPPVSHSSPQYLQVVNLPSEVDFSPSTRSVPLHPVPLSSNGGATLDWTGSHSEEDNLDRRWTISRGKRKAKDRMLPSSKPIVEKQEALFTGLSREYSSLTSTYVSWFQIEFQGLELRHHQRRFARQPLSVNS